MKVNHWTCSGCLSVELPFHNTRDMFNLTNINTNILNDSIPFELPTVSKLNQYRQHFSIAHLNTQSITSTFAQFEAMLNIHQFDIITLSETWLKDNANLLSSVEIPGYNNNFRNRDRVKGGGVGYYVKNNINVKERKDLTNLDETIEHQWIEISGQKKSPNIVVGNFYQPSSKLQDKIQFLEKFETLISQVTLLYEGPIIITGDFNIDLAKVSPEAERYKDILDSFNLVQHGTQPTRNSKSLIDHIISSQDIKPLDHGLVFCDEISDHDAPFCIFKAAKMKYEPRYKVIRDERNLDMVDYMNDFQSLPLSLVYVFDTASDKVNVLNNMITDCIQKHAPLRKVKITRPPSPWMKDLNINNLQRDRNRARANFKRNPNVINHEHLKSVRNELKRKIKETKSTFTKKLLSNKNCSETWKVINKILHPNPTSVKVDPSEVNKFFNQTATRTTGKTSESITREFIQSLPEQENNFNLREVTHKEVLEAIKSVRSDCSTGYDNIPAKFVKPVAEHLASPLTHIINHSIITSTVPVEWKISRICPVPKTKNPKSLSEYRPISILPILSKVFERVILKQITELIENESIYDSQQSGFRKGHSTATILLKLKEDILRAMKKGEVTLTILADFSKAFDTVDYKVLLKELHRLGFSRNFLLLLKDYLSSRQQYVQVDDKSSSQLEVEFGVPQGSILGPVLFNLYVTTISSNGRSTYLVYADDTTLLRHTKVINLPQAIDDMQLEVNKVNIWSGKKNLCLNGSKTKVILFSTSQMYKRHKLQNEMVRIYSNNQQLENITDVKILGVRFNHHLSWRSHINSVTQGCYSTLKSLRIFKRSADFDLRKSLAQSLILSRINYGNVLLSGAPHYLLRKLQKLQNAAAGFVYKRHTNVNDVVKLKWLPVQERISLSLVKLAHKALRDVSWPAYLKLTKVPHRGRSLRSDAENENNVDLAGGFEGSFTQQAGSCFNELPINLKSIENFETFSSKCFAYFLDKAIARIYSLKH